MYTTTQLPTTIDINEGQMLTLTHVRSPNGINHPRYTITKNDEVLGQVDWYNVGLYLKQNERHAPGINVPICRGIPTTQPTDIKIVREFLEMMTRSQLQTISWRGVGMETQIDISYKSL